MLLYLCSALGWLLFGMCNACNLADGLDGLAAGSSVIIMVVMAAVSYRADSLSCAIVSSSCCWVFMLMNLGNVLVTGGCRPYIMAETRVRDR